MFSIYGTLKKCGILWDDLGRSKGVALIEYEKPEAARKAIKEYHGAKLDERPL